ncbi:MAG: hypothetical protein Q7S04_00315 [Candidatus Moranbacteria bacterium]|nr:hypothetical protein [Candidatus Moranbacteria bacterium]
MAKKPAAASMKPIVSHPEPPTLSHQDRRASSQHGHGLITEHELGGIAYKLQHKLGEKRGGEIKELLEENMHGGVLREIKVDKVMHELKRNHHDDIRQRDIDKLEDIIDSKL